MVERHPLQLQFKGDRNYLQGPDIFASVLSRLQTLAGDKVTDIDFSFHRMASRAVDLVLAEEGKDLDPVAVCQYSIGNAKQRAYVVEADGPVQGRYEYPEQELVDAMTIDVERRICALQRDLPYADIEIWVAMTKALHQKVFTNLKGKWLFVQGALSVYEAEGSGPRELSIKSNLNNKLTRSEAIRGGRKIGEIYFSII